MTWHFVYSLNRTRIVHNIVVELFNTQKLNIRIFVGVRCSVFKSFGVFLFCIRNTGSLSYLLFTLKDKVNKNQKQKKKEKRKREMVAMQI